MAARVHDDDDGDAVGGSRDGDGDDDAVGGPREGDGEDAGTDQHDAADDHEIHGLGAELPDDNPCDDNGKPAKRMALLARPRSECDRPADVSSDDDDGDDAVGDSQDADDDDDDDDARNDTKDGAASVRRPAASAADFPVSNTVAIRL